MPSRYPRHGQIDSQITVLLKRAQKASPGRHVVSDDAGVITERDPDTFRGPDVAFYSFARVPPGPFQRDQYLAAVPDLVFEVRSPTDRWRDLLGKVHEFLNIGVSAVCVLDDETGEAQVFDDQGISVLDGNGDLKFPQIVPGFRSRVRQFFE